MCIFDLKENDFFEEKERKRSQQQFQKNFVNRVKVGKINTKSDFNCKLMFGKINI